MGPIAIGIMVTGTATGMKLGNGGTGGIIHGFIALGGVPDWNIICCGWGYAPSETNDVRLLVLLSRRVRMSEAEEGGVEYMDGGREEPRWLPAILAGRELPGDEFAKGTEGRWMGELDKLISDDCLGSAVSSYFGLE